MWIDESKFEVFGSNRRTFVRCRTNEKMLEQYLNTFSQAWWRECDGLGCFGGGKIGDLYRVEGTLRKEIITRFCNAMPYPVNST